MSLADLRRVLHVPGACGKEGEATTKSAHAGQSSRPGQAGLLPARQEVVEATVPDGDRVVDFDDAAVAADFVLLADLLLRMLDRGGGTPGPT